MTREPQDTRPVSTPGDKVKGTPPLREFQPARNDARASPAKAPWSAFVARILRPAASIDPAQTET